MRLIHFSMFFPVKHPKAGQPTYFKESILNGRKIHTFRKHRVEFRAGQQFKPVAWSDKPYRSQIIDLCDEPITIVETYPFVKIGHSIKISGAYANPEIVANNDGLELQDFYDWFPYRCDGYIICWQSAGYIRKPQNDVPAIHTSQLSLL